jgi:hypothetical protein
MKKEIFEFLFHLINKKSGFLRMININKIKLKYGKSSNDST